ncbi:uncharacterized protein HaLaN_03071, partial [Haematococcus lacustris]
MLCCAAGTPLQNRLSELWGLMQFLMPGAFGPITDFERWFMAPLEALRCGPPAAGATATSGAEVPEAGLTEEEFMLATNRLHQVLRPFMLRRLKESVATELPAKAERVVRCAASPYQTALNQL